MVAFDGSGRRTSAIAFRSHLEDHLSGRVGGCIHWRFFFLLRFPPLSFFHPSRTSRLAMTRRQPPPTTLLHRYALSPHHLALRFASLRWKLGVNRGIVEIPRLQQHNFRENNRSTRAKTMKGPSPARPAPPNQPTNFLSRTGGAPPDAPHRRSARRRLPRLNAATCTPSNPANRGLRPGR